MPISVASRKAKGRKLQQFVRDLILKAFKPHGVRDQDVLSTSMGVSGEDIKFSPFARDLLNISVECKSHKAFAVYKIYEQCQSNAGDYEPVVFIKQNNSKPLALVDAEFFINLLAKKDKDG